jgi:hypothetical protein
MVQKPILSHIDRTLFGDSKGKDCLGFRVCRIYLCFLSIRLKKQPQANLPR